MLAARFAARRRVPLAAVAAVTAVAGVVASTGAVAAGSTTGPSDATGAQTYVVRSTTDAGTAAHAVQSSGGTVLRTIGLIDGVVARLSPARAAQVAGTPGITDVTPDAKVTLASSSYDASGDVNSLYNTEQLIGARSFWSKGTGAGVDVALVDSGVAPVDGLKGKVVNGPDLSFDSQNPDVRYLDEYGHGTHMAGIIAGHDGGTAATPDAGPGAFLGVAPDARIVNVKVADAQGNSDVSQVIAGIDWVVQHAHDNGLNIRVLNLSFGTDSAQAYTLDPLAYAAEQAWKHGIVVVVSAGNSGSSSGRLTDPGYDPYLLAVGADDPNGTISTGDDTIPAFSSNGDGTRNPDVVAPGVHLQGLRVPGSFVDAGHPGAVVGDRFFRGSGTSQAAAVVSGVAALLLSARPCLTPDQVKAALMVNANPLPAASRQAQGSGLVSLRSITSVYVPSTITQSWTSSTGTGSLEASRGSAHVVMNSTALRGDQDIFGTPVDTSALAGTEASASSWNGGTWNGSSWAGSSWAGSSWAGSSWAGSSWAGSSWAGSSWATGTWTGSSWAGSSWAGSSWAGSSWAGSSWAGSSWATGDWS